MRTLFIIGHAANSEDVDTERALSENSDFS